MLNDKLFEQIFQLGMTAKQFSKESQKSERKQKLAMDKIKIALQKNDNDLAKRYAQEALMHKADTKSYKTLSSKISHIYSKLNYAYKTQQLNQSIANLVGKMNGATKISNVTKMLETMEKFETMVDNLDVSDKKMNDVFDNVNAGTVNEQEVNTLIDNLMQKEGMRIEDNMVDPISHNPMGQKVQGNKQQSKMMSENFFP